MELKLPSLLGRVHPMFHSSLLKLVEDCNIQPFPLPPGLGKLQYLVWWKGYPFTNVSCVMDVMAPQLLRKFHRKYPHKTGERYMPNDSIS
ncbi:hypothetical protein E2320_007824 [Naja naja]|nr:hypothetical protein E2320_007824 [Naja naja]